MINETHKEEIDFLVKHSDKNLPEVLRMFAEMKISEQLIIGGVVKSLPSIIEIDFDGHLKCQIQTTDKI
jgi:hypothetical protein